jgi:hypothetical protein
MSISKGLESLLLGGWLLLQLAPSTAATLHLNSGAQQLTLIELYTSQGCSSCPPAERWLGDLQSDLRLWNSLIPVAFHVDYWDYIGWKDSLARAEFSARQQRYHQQQGIKSVYTPGFVVNGKEWRSWFGLRKLPISSQSVGLLLVDLDGERLKAEFQPVKPVSGPLTLNVALVGVGLAITVTAGENSGKRLPQDFSVLEYVSAVAKDGRWDIQLPQVSEVAGVRQALVVWVSTTTRLEPLQAVGGWLASDL